MIHLKWLDKKPKVDSGVTWGIPWKRGVLKKEDSVVLRNGAGDEKEVEMWPMAYWPDGSIKWSAQAAIFEKDCHDEYALDINRGKKRPLEGISVIENNNEFIIDTGAMKCYINKSGTNIVEKIIKGNTIVCKEGKLILIDEIRDENKRIYNKYLSDIKYVSLEQIGKIRTVVKVTGTHKYRNEELSPFEVRLVFYKNEDEIKIVHTFFYDGDPQKDFIKGIALDFKLDLRGSEFNRYASFALEEGMYLEPAKLLLSRHYHINNYNYEKQIDGQPVDVNDLEQGLQEKAVENALWNDFKLIQDNSNHYKIVKRCKENLTYVDVLHGNKSKGLAYIGDENKGMTIALKCFWQKNPSALEISSLGKEESHLTLWLWDTSVEAMDLRHYSDTYHMSAYEGFEEVRSTPVGIGNTSEISIKVFDKVPNKKHVYKIAEEVQKKSLLIAEPEYYHDTKATGVWSMPDKSTKIKAYLEDELENNFNFYKNEVIQRNWYGYWNFGDVMHTYDGVRHQWRYDLGGYAWQNTELAPNIWLWYQFLRTGNKEVFYMAEAMARHTSEVDRYHFGEYQGLGSRHNVVHWGCSCKEVRISMAGLQKIYYYLTADERMGDILREVRDVDQTTEKLEPLRGYFPEDKGKIHLRVGPDWSSFCSNWETEWERTENIVYRDKITQGINYLKQHPFRLLSGPAMRYNPAKSMLEYMGDGNTKGYHMIIAFGAPQVWMEIADLIEDEDWKDMIAEFGAFYALSNEEKIKRSKGVLSDKNFAWPMFSAGMVAYAARRYKNEKLAQKAWQLIASEINKESHSIISNGEIQAWQKINEDKHVTTNCVSQWSINTIVCLELIGDYLNKENLL